jgi:ABC-type sugar transport system substrate-binding protein
MWSGVAPSPITLDPWLSQARLAIDSKVDGIATTLVTPDALIPTVQKAVQAGIPVDSVNSGLAELPEPSKAFRASRACGAG